MTLPRINNSKKTSKSQSKCAQKLLEKHIICNLCNVRFTQKKALYVHLRNKHHIEPLEKKAGTVQCPQCKNMFYDKYNLKRHCRTAHGISPTRNEKRIILRGRVVDTNRKPKFIQNIETNYSLVDDCIEPENNPDSEKTQLKTFIKEYICNTCEETFKSKLVLIRHIGDVHAELRNFRCTECNEDFPNKQFLLQHTHPVEKYATLEKILPEAYKYEVVQHVQINDTSFVSEVYCNLNSREDADYWLDKFQRKNKVTYRRMRRQCQSFDQSYTFIIDRYRCQHNTLPKRRSTPHAKHTGCSATLFIRIYQHKNFPQLSWSRIRIKHTHNHRTEAAAKFRDPIKEVVNKFRVMFQAGKGPKAALNEHMRDLQLSYGDDIISDRGICPTSRWVYNFYQKLIKQRYESSDKNEPIVRCSDLETKNQVFHETNLVSKNSDLPLSMYNKLIVDKPLHIPTEKVTLANHDDSSVSSMNPVSSPNKYTICPSNIRDNSIKYNYLSPECPDVSNDTNRVDNTIEQISYQMNSCVSNDTDQMFLNQVNASKKILQEFDQVISQIRSRIITNPVYFLNAMKNFIQTYNSTLNTPSSLNSALHSFGKYSEFQLNQL